MFNSQRPRPEDLPTSGQLIRATAFAAVAAGAILVAVILPSEYAIDPTGVGRTLGLTQMGEIKLQLAEEAARDAAMEAAAPATVAASTPTAPQPADTKSAATRTDTTKVTLAPGQGAEIKAVMAKGASVKFAWSVEGGHVNFDTHADAPGVAYHGYGKGKESTGESGTLVAAFDGKHGWFWRNRSGVPVTITLRTDGAYTDIRRVV
ncbi:conserved protein of unknown function [uncultured Sphingopyxis sp.]|uniref:Transmembrane anchor protein n=1 Tax=uncultured Sphingopyxis sp. TaxID=310581 RepID=A0A1Y5PP55_9SPHN|nr:transmembrane anchor protein [uncultured Sphingopyxis sp.]SBV31843.1 conserved protein of unknown function [uncultured Sphingopyxis sp.]